MILLAILIAAQLAPGCRPVERAILCELEPPVRVAPPPPKPIAEAEGPPPRRRHRRPIDRSAGKPAATPTTAADIAHHVELLVAIADCTGVRTLLTATGSATAESTYRACVGGGGGPAPSGRNLAPVPGETAAVRVDPKPVEHP